MDVSTPGEGTIVLNAEGTTTCHLHRALVIVLHGTLMFIDSLVGHQGESILDTSPCSIISHTVIITGFLEMIGFRRICPPSIKSHLIEIGEIMPIDVTCLWIKRIVWQYASLLRPCIKRQQSIDFLQLLIGFCPGTEIGPYTNHEMCIVLMHIIYHGLRGLYTRRLTCCYIVGCHFLHIIRQVLCPCRITYLIDIVRIHKTHGIPVGVTSPVLPVLNNTVQWYMQLPIFIQHFCEFITGFISLTALPMPHGPKRKHSSLTGQFADSGYHSVLCAISVDEIIISTKAYFRRKLSCFFCIIIR